MGKLLLNVNDDDYTIGENVLVTGNVIKYTPSSYEEIWIAVSGDGYTALTFEQKIKDKITNEELIRIVESGDFSELTKLSEGYITEYADLQILKYDEPKEYEDVMNGMEFLIDYDRAKHKNVYKLK
jgi:hypothetical protein